MKYLLAMSLSALVVSGALAVDVTTTAGHLREALGADRSIASLTVKGAVDASDLEFIRDSLPSLVTLDLGGTTVSAYSGEPLSTGATVAAANTVAPYSLMSLGVKTLVLPAGVTDIAAGAFAGCRSLSSVVIPQSVVTVGDHAFMDCDRLQSVTLGHGVITVGDNAFARCGSLRSVALPASVATVGRGAFSGCRSLSTVDFGIGLTVVGDNAFEGCALTSASLSRCSRLQSVGAFSFASCEALVSVELPAGVELIGRGAFFGDRSLRSVALPAAITVLPDFALAGASSLDNAALLPGGVEEIGDYALHGMESARSVVLPGSLSYVGSHAMDRWRSLESVDASGVASVPALGDDVWGDLDKSRVDLYVSESLADIFSATPQWEDFNIRPGLGGTDEVVLPGGEVTARVADGTLVVSSTGDDVAAVAVYDFSGTLLLRSENDSNRAVVDVSSLPVVYFIAEVTLADGSRHSFKLSRNNI